MNRESRAPVPAQPPKIQRIWTPFLRFILRILAAVCLEEIRVRGEQLPEEGPWVLAANHLSGWDGFILDRLVKSQRPRMRLYTLLLTRSWKTFRSLRGVGTVPLEPGNATSLRQALRSLQAAQVQSAKRTAVCIFPQGRIRTGTVRPLEFQAGVEAVSRAVDAHSIIPVAMHWEATPGLRPRLLIQIGKALPSATSSSALETAITEMLEEIQTERNLDGETLSPGWRKLP